MPLPFLETLPCITRLENGTPGPLLRSTTRGTQESLASLTRKSQDALQSPGLWTLRFLSLILQHYADLGIQDTYF